jgi:hypothetical protein
MRGWSRWFGVAAAGAIFFLAAAPAVAQKIETGYDKAADFSRYKTYAWIPRVTPATNPVLSAIISNNIDYELKQKGLRKVDANPDLLVKSYGGAEDVTGGFAAIDPSHIATGGDPMPGADMWAGSLPPTPVPQIMEGSITVDLVDARQKHVVWRATAKGKMDYDKRSKLLEQANKAVAAMFKKYPPAK